MSYLCKGRKMEGANLSRILYVYVITQGVHTCLTKALYNE